jgi:hypothetical protein
MIESSQSEDSQVKGSQMAEEWDIDVTGETTTLGLGETQVSEVEAPIPAYFDQLIPTPPPNYETNFEQLTKVHDTITDFKDIASLWLLSLQPHKYIKELRVDIDLFIMKVLIKITKINAILESMD